MGKRDDVLISPKAKYPEGLHLAGSLRQIAEGHNEFDADFDEGAVQQAREELLSLAERCEMLSKETPAGYVRHVLRRGDYLVAQATCYDVSAMLSALRERFQTAIYTSATLSTGPEDFRYFTAHNGVFNGARTLQVGSPFDYRRQALLYLPATMPEPDYQHRDIFDEAARQEMTALVRASGGGAMLLFTSYYAMNAAADYLARVLVYPVRRQKEAPKPALIEWLKARHDGVLCATASFWEGVDIPGESLRLLVIDKIPFAQPTPVEMARQGAAGRNAFLELSVPEATLKLKQGFGRLIRSCSDYGVVAMLDPRLWLKGYGRRIVGALPDARVVRSVGEVRAFFARRMDAIIHVESPQDPWAAALAELMTEEK
jgi:ATP-dependent DNA helicase DinG